MNSSSNRIVENDIYLIGWAVTYTLAACLFMLICKVQKLREEGLKYSQV